MNADFDVLTEAASVHYNKNQGASFLKNRRKTVAGERKAEIQPLDFGILDKNVYQSIRDTLKEARAKTHSAINFAMVEAYWDIGRQIEEAVGGRAEYGKGLLRYLAQRLMAEFGKGFDESCLRRMRQFYAVFPIRATLWHELSWSHYRLLMKIDDAPRREFYTRECVEAAWSVRQLERQINSFYYERLLATQKSGREDVKNEIQALEPKMTPDYILKDPYILEFLDLKENRDYRESDLEQALIDKLQGFLLELGKGFSFVARQKRITIEGDHYYIDLVFYNYILKCFVLIDLKTDKLKYQDIGQIDCMRRVDTKPLWGWVSTLRQIPYHNNHTPPALGRGMVDFYVRYFDEKFKQPDDNPTIGIILCTDKNETMAKYSVLSDNENLFASKYMLYLPTEEELLRELKRERELIEQQHRLEKEGDQ